VLVSATRGDGGQNEIGPELFQSLGVLRTEELLAVHRFDGAEQFFTRAVDFGFSFSVEESIEKWGHDEIVGDYVRHIRTLRPDVIAGFLCGGEGGGQHHQASTRLTIEAFRAAADPARYPDQIAQGLRPWQAKRVFCTDSSSFSQQSKLTNPARDLLTVNVTGFDPLLGRTYSELGLEARSMHKCQGTSQLLMLPGQTSNRTYRLRDSVIGEAGVAPPALFDGVNTSLAGLAAFAGGRPPEALTAGTQAIAAAVASASKALSVDGPSAAAAPLATGLAAVRGLRAKLATLGLDDTARYEIDFRLARKETQFQEALVTAFGMRIEALADDGVVIPGQPVKLSLVIGNHGPSDAAVKSIKLDGFARAPTTCTGTAAKDGAFKCDVANTIPAEARVTGPYWTPRRDAARYDFEPDAPFGYPFRPSPFRATVVLTLAGADVQVERVVQYRYDNVVAGEKRMELAVVSALAVSLTPDIVVIPTTAARGSSAQSDGREGPRRDVQVSVANQHKGAAEGVVSLDLPRGWTATPSQAPVRFAREGEEATARFSIAPVTGVAAGEYSVKARVREGSATFDAGYDVVEYPHIHRRHVPESASARVKVIDVKVDSDARVGYVMGVGDQVPAALEQIGARVEMITPDVLASGDLSRYTVIVTGVRAYERRPDLRANNNRLLQYVEDGGTVLVQYNKFEFNEAQYGPYPAKVSSNRVTDENSPVEILEPENRIFSKPNRIGPDAWAGWVQERGLYFLGDRDSRYADLVRLSDPFEYNRGPKTGALVEARYGKGRWIYIGLGLWRQLPAGTAGAYQLMANLISLH